MGSRGSQAPRPLHQGRATRHRPRLRDVRRRVPAQAVHQASRRRELLLPVLPPRLEPTLLQPRRLLLPTHAMTTQQPDATALAHQTAQDGAGWHLADDPAREPSRAWRDPGASCEVPACRGCRHFQPDSTLRDELSQVHYATCGRYHVKAAALGLTGPDRPYFASVARSHRVLCGPEARGHEPKESPRVLPGPVAESSMGGGGRDDGR